jgi:hypothetical protein
MRAAATQMALYLGYEGPGPTSLDRGPEMVPLAARSTLLSTFNSGFYEKDGSAGFYTHRTLFFPMVKGLGTVVEYANGSYDVMAWQGGPTPGSSVAMARQNLPLIVDNGHATTPTANHYITDSSDTHGHTKSTVRIKRQHSFIGTFLVPRII